MTQAELDAHLRVEDPSEICPLRSGAVADPAADPEDGISPEVDERLRNRTASRQVLNWHALWGTLFPNDSIVPDSGEISMSPHGSERDC